MGYRDAEIRRATISYIMLWHTGLLSERIASELVGAAKARLEHMIYEQSNSLTENAISNSAVNTFARESSPEYENILQMYILQLRTVFPYHLTP